MAYNFSGQNVVLRMSCKLLKFIIIIIIIIIIIVYLLIELCVMICKHLWSVY